MAREIDKHNTQPEDKRERNKGRRRKKQERGKKGETEREKVVTKELGCSLSVQHS